MVMQQDLETLIGVIRDQRTMIHDLQMGLDLAEADLKEKNHQIEKLHILKDGFIEEFDLFDKWADYQSQVLIEDQVKNLKMENDNEI